MAEESLKTTNSLDKSKLMKILCYAHILWLIPYFVVKGDDRDENFIFNVKQGLGPLAFFALQWILNHIEFGTLAHISCIIGVVLALIGAINVIRSKEAKLPLIGTYLDKLNIK